MVQDQGLVPVGLRTRRKQGEQLGVAQEMEQKKQVKGWDSFLPFYSQWYWQEALMHPYERTKAYYHGPRCDWMNLMEDDDDTDSA